MNRPWERELRALRDDDRTHAPPFEAMLAQRNARRTRRMLIPAGAAAAAAIVALWVAWPRHAPEVTVPLDAAAWRSPTAALLVIDLASTRSPTASLIRPLALPEKPR